MFYLAAMLLVTAAVFLAGYFVWSVPEQDAEQAVAPDKARRCGPFRSSGASR